MSYSLTNRTVTGSYSIRSVISCPTSGSVIATAESWRPSEVTRSPDGSLRYSLELTPVWVLTPGYRITPSEVGDTLSMPADSRLRYERFMTDTRLLLGL